MRGAPSSPITSPSSTVFWMMPVARAHYANSFLKDRILFGSDYPLIMPDRWMKDFSDAGFKPEVQPGILKGNAMRLLKLGA